MASDRGPDIVVLGAGSWGTALALHLARAGHLVRLWVHDAVQAERLAATRENARYLPGHPLPETISIHAELDAALVGASDVLLVVPSQHCRAVLTESRPHLGPNAAICSASKGIENTTLLRITEVIEDVVGPRPLAVLSGPSFAREVAQDHPTAVVIGAASKQVGTRFQHLLSAGNFRAYTNDDLAGVEIGGALKNVIAIGAGAVEGLGYGTNTIAALITRGLAEMGRLAGALGGRPATLAGLAGLGDLVLTCTGNLSRNRALGSFLARGGTIEQYRAETRMVAEGVATTASVWALARRERVDMPITRQVHAILHEGRPVEAAIRDLLSRQLTSEDGSV